MIYVTKEQAKVIGKYHTSDIPKYSMVYSIAVESDIDLVTIARIVEGESYEIGREFKVGDIVLGNTNGEFYTVEKVNGYRLTVKLPRIDRHVFEGDADLFTLVCAVENREDLTRE